jgi:hypothetical protein
MKMTRNENENSWSDYIPEAAGALAALGTYGALRRFSPHLSPRLRKIQEASRDSGVSVAFPLTKERDRLAWGVDKISEMGEGPVILNGNIGRGAKGGRVTINSDDVHQQVADKGRFGDVMKELSPDAIPRTENFDEVMRNPKLARLFKDQKTYVKSRFDSRAADQASDDVFPSLDEAKAMELDRPKDYIVQQKLPVQDEFRAHYIAGQPFGIYKRWLPESVAAPIRKLYGAFGKDFAGGGFWPAAKADREALDKFMRESLDPLTKKFKEGDELFGGFDVIKTPEGFKIVDANTVPATIENPLVSRKLYKLMTGRWGKDVAAAGAIGAGGIATAGGHMGMNYADE